MLFNYANQFFFEVEEAGDGQKGESSLENTNETTDARDLVIIACEGVLSNMVVLQLNHLHVCLMVVI